MSRAPIGVFDSGLGGLTAVKELRRLLPGEDIVYFGDTGRVPYGTRGHDTIIEYAKQDIALLLSKGVKTIVAACGTVSSTLPPEDMAYLPVRYTGVVEPTAAAAAKATKNGKIGIIGTEATVATDSYGRVLRRLLPGVEISTQACPLFVPLTENGHCAPDDALVKYAVELYLAPIKRAGVDTLILGCTHYPLLADAIALEMGKNVALIDSGRQTADAMKGKLVLDGLLNGRTEGGTTQYYVTDDPGRFNTLAARFLGGDTGGPVERVYNIDAYSLKRILRGISPLQEGNGDAI